VLISFGNAEQIATFGLSAGYDWSECTMGTNGAGTALALRKAVAVVGSEHYIRAFENCTCTAAPIFDAVRNLAGAIDVSSSVEEASPDRLSAVIATAREIEQDLYAIGRSKYC
jgi:transcriptional regulator of acetoin/glycerol metabolism